MGTRHPHAALSDSLRFGEANKAGPTAAESLKPTALECLSLRHLAEEQERLGILSFATDLESAEVLVLGVLSLPWRNMNRSDSV